MYVLVDLCVWQSPSSMSAAIVRYHPSPYARPCPHLRRDSAHPSRICAGIGRAAATSAPGLAHRSGAHGRAQRRRVLRRWRWRVSGCLQTLARARAHTHTHTHTHARTHAHTHTHTHTRTRAHKHTHARTLTHAHTRAATHARTHTLARTCTWRISFVARQAHKDRRSVATVTTATMTTATMTTATMTTATMTMTTAAVKMAAAVRRALLTAPADLRT
jgi:hypothetical protein